MEIIKKIDELKKTIKETDVLVGELISNFKKQLLKVKEKEEKIIQLKEEVGINIKRIDGIIEDYNANS